MTPIASHITAFLRERLPVERMASPNTCDTYAYAFQLLFEFAVTKLKAAPSDLCLEQLDASLVLAFLAHPENDRGCCPSSRNARLTVAKAAGRRPSLTKKRVSPEALRHSCAMMVLQATKD